MHQTAPPSPPTSAADPRPDRRAPRRARAGLLATLVAGLTAVFGLALAPPAAAAPDVAHHTGLRPAAAAQATACTPDDATACLIGTMRTAGGAPAVGVVLEVSGPSGTFAVTTDGDGRWALAVAESGDYTVALDVSTLPAGETLRDPTVTERTVAVELGRQSGVLFALGSPTTAPPSPTATPGEDETEAAVPVDDGEVPPPPVAAGTNRVAQQFANGLVFGLLLALASVGLSLVYGTTGLSSFSHGEQVTLGAIVAFVMVQLVGVPLWPAIAVAMVVGALSGWAQDAGIWRPLRRRRVGLTQQMIVTIGLAMALQYVFQFLFGGGRLRIVTSTSPPVRLGPVLLTVQTLTSAAIAVVVLGAVAYFLLYTRTGRATRAVSDNPALAAASGIGVERVVRLVWVGAAALAALGGVLVGLYQQATTWNMGGTMLLLMFAAATLGGLGTAFGALAGSMVIGIVSEMASLVMPADLRYAGALLILILVLLVRPQGILGRRDRIG